MNCIVRRLLPALVFWTPVLTIGVPAQAQDINVSAVVSSRPATSVLDSTKEQDGLLGSVRRVKTETAKIELKDGRAVEGPTQLIEVTTYGVKGNRIENTSYPAGGSAVGKEEYKYDDRGNITEMTVRDDRGAILSREAYAYQFDKFGNWTKMVTSLVVFENGELKREPVEVTYRTVTYYFDDTIAKIVEEPKPVVEEPRVPVVTAQSVPEASNGEVAPSEILRVSLSSSEPELATAVGEPPGLLKRFAIRKERESVSSVSSAAESKPAPSIVESKPASSVVENTPAPAITLNTDQQVAYDFYVTGAEHLRLQKDREAIKAFKESIKLNPNSAETLYGLGFSSFRLGRFRDAADAFKKATTLEPRMAKAHYGLSLAYQELGNTKGVLDEYRILETLDRSLAKKLAQTFPQFNLSCRLVQGCP